ncbi:MAG: PTS glucose transporter subunit IIA [Acholeplasmataceae bacterium]
MKRNDSPKTEALALIMPVEGRIYDLEYSPDDTFRRGTAGPGFVIDPADHVLYAPFTGTIELIYPTRHVIVIRSLSGVDVMIHIGFDREHLRGEAIELMVEPGQTVSTGDPLASFDRELLALSYAQKAILVIFLQKKGIELRTEDETNYRVTIRT